MPELAIPLWFKLAYTAFVLYVMAVWWKHYGWKNFLWFSDIAFIGAVPAMWMESAALASVLAVAVLVPELLWNADYALRLALRRRITGLTDYMFEPDRLLLLRGLSLFHVPLPLVLLWMIAAYGYDASVGLPGAVALGAVVLPWSRILSTPEKNINWTYGFGAQRVTWPGWLFVPLLFVGFVLFVFIPTDWLLRTWFGG
jgi:hypothetical protein